VASDSSMAVYVFDAATLTLVGVLPAPEACPSVRFGNCQQGVMAVDAVHREAHYVPSTGLSKTFVYDLLP